MAVQLEALVRCIDADGHDRLVRGGFQCLLIPFFDTDHSCDARWYTICGCVANALGRASSAGVGILLLSVCLARHLLHDLHDATGGIASPVASRPRRQCNQRVPVR